MLCITIIKIDINLVINGEFFWMQSLCYNNFARSASENLVLSVLGNLSKQT